MENPTNNAVDFDALVLKTVSPDATIADLDTLYGHAFALPQWYFIARGESPNVQPYIAANPAYEDGKYMVRAFTDTDRLQRFVKEHNLETASGGSMVLSIPTGPVIEYLEVLMNEGVHGIWFNSDAESYGFFVAIAQLRHIKVRLESLRQETRKEV